MGWAILSLIISQSPVNSHLDLPIVRSHLRMVVVAAERRRGLGMRSLETVLARAGKTKDQFYAHCDQIAAPYRAWMFEMAEDNDGAWTNEEILASAKAVYAVWEDRSKPNGIGVLWVKGFLFLTGNTTVAHKSAHTTAIKCGSEAEARLLIQ